MNGVRHHLRNLAASGPKASPKTRRRFGPQRAEEIDLPAQVEGRVGMWRGGLGMAYRSGPFVCRGFTSPPMPRFHIPLIEPDVPN